MSAKIRELAACLVLASTRQRPRQNSRLPPSAPLRESPQAQFGVAFPVRRRIWRPPDAQDECLRGFPSAQASSGSASDGVILITRSVSRFAAMAWNSYAVNAGPGSTTRKRRPPRRRAPALGRRPGAGAWPSFRLLCRPGRQRANGPSDSAQNNLRGSLNHDLHRLLLFYDCLV